ncbi:MAG: hypothetical protein ABIG29_00610 [Candidatus Nealsonbacteria bacterium]
MRITFQLQENIQSTMRRCGYFFDRTEKDEFSFIRTLGASRSGYPRFHIYVKVDDVSREAVINLHLDQKKPIYEGVAAHSGEYDGELVERELARIKQILGP